MTFGYGMPSLGVRGSLNDLNVLYWSNVFQ